MLETTTAPALDLRHAGFGNAATAVRFALAGKAHVTFVSRRTGTRFTFRIVRCAGEEVSRPWFVSVLCGSDNDNDYAFLGTIFADGRFVHGRKSKIGASAPSAKAFAWAWAKLLDDELPGDLQIVHDGHCGRCRQHLTVPASVAAGLGPKCRGAR